ncbi:hypothetical protein H2198_002453 [Neophaeococcomyces mojaviensis]|uniref:Uncharacterized protein n=1 Tax=Neophaeococcomyces mojaviensis TaxID=3383035 RepID=A0ACC3ADZ9_9EURO|nr:hypothetical protein H2198_002453 [Knufia sp. JES_112]
MRPTLVALKENIPHGKYAIKRFKIGQQTAKREHWGSILEEGPLASQCRKLYNNFTPSLAVNQIARIAQNARIYSMQIPPFTKSQPLSQENASEAVAQGCWLRSSKGQKEGGLRTFPVGRKIGFTNKNIWAQYNVDAPNWGYMYNQTILGIPTDRTGQSRKSFRMKRTLEPKIEPEIVFGIGQTPTASMNDEELLSCVSWVCHGFEIVESIFPDWKFNAVDTTIAGGLHRVLLLDNHNMRSVSDIKSHADFLTQLQNFEIDLFCNGKLVDQGKGSNVLGSPIKALKHLVELLNDQTLHPQIMPGEIITTGTLTKALPINDGDVWHTHFRGIELGGYRVQFELTDPTIHASQKYLDGRNEVLRYIQKANASV